MRMPTYDTRQGRQSPHAAAVAAHGTGAGTAWEQELGQGSIDQDTWLVSFVDILMLLLTLFVLLLAYKDDPVQILPVQKVVAAPVVEASSALTPPAPIEVALPASQPESNSPREATVELPEEPALLMTAPPDLHPYAAPRKPLTQIAGMPGMFGLPANLEVAPAPPVERVVQAEEAPTAPAHERSGSPVEKLLAQLQDSSLRDRVEVTVLPDSVNLEISDSILFAPASAALTETGTQLLDELAATLKTHPYTLSVEGHTDNVPIKTTRFPSNWELSSTRATEVTRRLIERGIAPERVRAVGYADTHPRADNASVEGRSRNRRVSLVLMEAAE